MAEFYSPVLEITDTDSLSQWDKNEVNRLFWQNWISREQFIQDGLSVYKDVMNGGFV